MRILVADDDPVSLGFIESILRKWDFEVTTVPDGDEAFHILEQESSPPLAILDWMMPKMTGIDICRKVRTLVRGREKYLILLTSLSGKNNVIEGLNAGANDYINKPFDKDELRARLSVAERVINLQNELVEREKMQGALEMAGAVCHEFNQPLQAISGYTELLQLESTENDGSAEMLKEIKKSVDRMGDLTKKLQSITRYMTMSYVGKTSIVDIHGSSSPSEA